MKRDTLILALTLSTTTMSGQVRLDADTITRERDMNDVVVRAVASTHSRSRVENTDLIGQGQLIRAACCNLGESFTTNPSVDVSYSDAATGARQIKLLGLSGTYVQMLTENIPNLRGAALPYSLGYVPGPWMQSIQVSKGASSVKNGYESTTGQINIEFLKPQGTDGIRANAYLDSELKQELNLDGSIHLNDRLSTSTLLHFENRQMDHDGNGDGFMDMPKLRQYNVMHRWAYVSPLWISQLSARILHDERESGMSHHHTTTTAGMEDHHTTTSAGMEDHHTTTSAGIEHYGVDIRNKRYEGQWKNGFTLNADRNMSVALMLHGSWHDAWNTFGRTQYDVTQKNGYAQLMFETDLGEAHNLSIGASINHDNYSERLRPYTPPTGSTGGTLPDGGAISATLPDGSSLSATLPVGSSLSATLPVGSALSATSPYGGAESTVGLYAQYTYKLGEKLTIMPGLRWDHSNRHGAFVTPRLHIRYAPCDILTLRASAGKGYRSPHALAENSPLLATGRKILIASNLKQEEAWNYGASAGLNVPVCGRNLELNAEYYYTYFLNQLVVNYDGTAGANTLAFQNLTDQATPGHKARSYSHTFQVDATYSFFDALTATAAFRMNDVKCTYDGQLRQKPLTSRYKALLTLSYKTPLELWHFDLTGQLTGPGELYDRTAYPAYFQLQAQVTREFRRVSIYLGGENLTNYKLSEPIRHASAPWSPAFDATQVWGPVTGAMAYIGIRFKIEKL